MATSKISTTEGSGKNIATHSFSEDAVTKELQRIVPTNSSGTEIGTSSNPIQVTLANTGANATAVKVDGSAVTQPVSIATNTPVGNVAHDAADSGAPLKVGAQARTTNPTAVADADRANLITDDLGKLIVAGSIRDLKVQQATTITSSTSETTVLTAAASTFHDVYGVIVVNTSATACDVTFKDATAGTTRFNIYVPAGDTRGFMLPESAAHPQASTNNNWTATCSASVASIKITMLAVKNI